MLRAQRLAHLRAGWKPSEPPSFIHAEFCAAVFLLLPCAGAGITAVPRLRSTISGIGPRSLCAMGTLSKPVETCRCPASFSSSLFPAMDLQFPRNAIKLEGLAHTDKQIDASY